MIVNGDDSMVDHGLAMVAHGLAMGAQPLLLVAVLFLASAGLLTLAYRRRLRRLPTPTAHADTRPAGTGGPMPMAMAEEGDGVERPMLVVIPDISGYTAFISHSRHALDHAQYVVGELLSEVAQAGAGTFRTCRPEGDALLMFCRLEEISAESDRLQACLLDMMAAFYDCRDRLVSENTCPCPACADIAGLDLKAVVHVGPVLEGVIGGFHALTGMTVIESHALLKNTVPGHRYLLLTDPARAIVDPAGTWPLVPHAETLAHGDRLSAAYLPIEPSELPRYSAGTGRVHAVKRACAACLDLYERATGRVAQ